MIFSDFLNKIIHRALATAYPELQEADLGIEITPATQEKFGHYQCNSAMRLSKIVKRPPREIAENIIGNLEEKERYFTSIEIAGPGFINITFSPQYLSTLLNGFLDDERLGITPVKREKTIVEFSSPNTAKEMHVGHLRSTIIGDCLARLFEFLGHDVLRLNHVGDWGTAFGMLIAYMKEEAREVLRGEVETDLPQLMQWYRASKKRFDEDEAFKTRARLEVVALQGGNPESLKAWEKICEISRKAYREVYELLDVKLIERGESFYNPMLPKVVADMEKKGLITLSEGAKCVFIEGFSIPLMMQKSDGGYTYDTTDVAAMKHRVETEKAKRIIVITDAGQGLHFQLVFHACVKAGYLDPSKVRFDHVTFGLVLGPDGKKFRTRSGETEKLIDLLTAAVGEAKRILIERKPEMTEEEADHVAQVLGIGAVKYADLSSNRMSDYVFSYDRMLRFDGNTAAFILYSYVRVNGIKRKIGNVDMQKLQKKGKIALEHPSEVQLGLHLLRFGEILDEMTRDLLPNHLTDYLFQLASKFNAFFRDCRVEGAPEQESRLLLSELTARTLKLGLHLLGLKTVERM